MRRARPVESRSSRAVARALLLVVCLGPFTLPAQAQAPSSFLALDRLEAEVNAALDRAIALIFENQREDGSFGGGSGVGQYASAYPMGSTALVVYALAKAGVPSTDPRMQRALAWLERRPFQKTYSVATLILALDAAGARDSRERLHAAADWLVKNVDSGSGMWAYPVGTPDLSNTQFAVLALRVAERHEFEVSPELWQRVIRTCLEMQYGNGSFSYNPRSASSLESGLSTGGLVTGGITVLLTALEALDAAGEHPELQAQAREALDRAWAWLDAYFTPTGDPRGATGLMITQQSAWLYYYLYGVERVGALSQRASVGGRAWYPPTAAHLLGIETRSGGWGSLENTSFAMLVLRRATLRVRPVTGGGARPSRYDRPAPTPTPEPVKQGPPGEQGPIAWAFTTVAPASNWRRREFDDGSWRRGFAGFGRAGARGLELGTRWVTADLWLRRRFDFDQPAASLELHALHNESLRLWINGVLVADAERWSGGEYRTYELPPAAAAALRPTGNVLAARVRNQSGAQSVDIRMGLRLPPAALFAARSENWTRSLPSAVVRSVPRWDHFGTLNDPDHDLLLSLQVPAPLADAAAASPRELARENWTTLEAANGLVELRGRASAVEFLGVSLHATSAFDGYLWMRAQHGLRLWLDGAPLAFHHRHGGSAEPALRFPVQLPAGEHRLVVALERPNDVASLGAQLVDLDGDPAAGVVVALASEPPVVFERPLARSEERELASASRALTPRGFQALRDLLSFDRETDVQSVGLFGLRTGTPAWIDRSDGEGFARAQGVLALHPESAEEPVRLLVRASLPASPRSMSLSVTTLREAVNGARLRVGVFDGTLRWLETFEVRPGTDRSAMRFEPLELSLTDFGAEDVTFVVECAPFDGQPPEPVFLDRVVFR